MHQTAIRAALALGIGGIFFDIHLCGVFNVADVLGDLIGGAELGISCLTAGSEANTACGQQGLEQQLATTDGAIALPVCRRLRSLTLHKRLVRTGRKKTAGQRIRLEGKSDEWGGRGPQCKPCIAVDAEQIVTQSASPMHVRYGYLMLANLYAGFATVIDKLRVALT